MKKKIISLLLCLMLILQGNVSAFAEEFIILDEAVEVSEEIVVEEETQFLPEDLGEELIIDEEIFEDAAVSLSQDDKMTIDSDALIEEEIETEGLIEESVEEEIEITLVETVELADATVFSNHTFNPMRTFSRMQYNGCFGNQLSGFALDLYNQRVNYYVTNRNIGTMVLENTPETSPYSFEATVYKEGEESYIAKNDEYKEFHNQIKMDMQSSLDAFIYDHPEIFWLRSGAYEIKISAIGSAAKGYVGYLKKITYEPTVAYPGAASDLSGYENGVARAIESIMDVADRNDDSQLTDLELVKAIHDYLCERLFYDTAAYEEHLRKEAAGQTISDYRLFSSAGAFLDSVGTGVVCEGYAKGFKVLCDRMNIPCVLIGGKVYKSNGLTEGHMWNGVKINGKWYLMDVTWDDGSYGYSYNYFLVGNITDTRVSTGNFMGAESSVTFVYPALEEDACAALDGVVHKLQKGATVPPTCVEAGYTEYRCTDVGCRYYRRDDFTEVNTANHTMIEQPVAGTCTEQAYIKHICTNTGCNYSFADQYTETDPNNHDYIAESVTAPTCTTVGYTTYRCSRCLDSYEGDQKEINPKNHDYQRKEVVSATCTAEGYSIYVCKRCKTSSKEIDKNALGHSYKSMVTAPTCKRGYTTYTCKRNGCSHTYIGNYQQALGYHPYKNGVCIGCGQGDTIKNAAISEIASQGYDPKGVKPAVTVKFGTNVLKNGKDYKLTYQNNTVRGTAKVTITGIGNYRGTVTKSFSIVKKRPAKLTFSSIADVTYTGKALKPKVTIKNNGTKLIKDTDYTITYSDNKEVGQAVITIKLKGNYYGSQKLYFNILPKEVSLQSVKSSAKGKMKVTWKKTTGNGSYQIQYSLNSNFKSAKTVTVKAKYTTKTIEKLISKKTYYVRIRGYKKADGEKYYSEWSKAKKVTIK